MVPGLHGTCNLRLSACLPKPFPHVSVVAAKETQEQLFTYKKLQSMVYRHKNPTCVLVSEWEMSTDGAASELFPDREV